MVYFTRPSDTIDSVAVMPFVNVSGDPNLEYLSDGLSDSIINRLSQLPNLKKVIALNSVLRYKGKQTDPQLVGRELGVRAVLLGRLVQRGDGLSINVELVDVQDNKHLWGANYDRKLADVTAVQTEIAQAISERLRLSLTGEEKKRLARHYTESGEAYQLYMMGRYYGRKRTKGGWEKSIEYFEKAIEKDPAYALAYAGLATTYASLGFTGLLAPRDARQKEEWAALKAMELDGALAEAHVAMAHLKILDLNWAGAEEERIRALELNPNSVEVQGSGNAYLSATGRFDEAMLHLKRALELDPLAPAVYADMGLLLYFARQHDLAIEHLRKALELDPNFVPAHARLTWAYLEKGMYEEAITEQKKAIALEDATGNWRRTALLGHTYAVAGRKEEARKILNDLQALSKQRYVAPYNFALIYIGLGDRDEAFAWLDKAYQDRPDTLRFIKVSPLYDKIRSDARFAELVRRMNLST
jgi:TolB-like protein/Tfp pilus assembly protein PilF